MDIINNSKCETMKKSIVMVITTITIVLFSCGGQKNTPSTSSTTDSANVKVDSARTDTSRN